MATESYCIFVKFLKMEINSMWKQLLTLSAISALFATGIFAEEIQEEVKTDQMKEEQGLSCGCKKKKKDSFKTSCGETNTSTEEKVEPKLSCGEEQAPVEEEEKPTSIV